MKQIEKEGDIMGWKLTFHFEDFPKIKMNGYVTVSNEQLAIDKFKSDYPNFAECIFNSIVICEEN